MLHREMWRMQKAAMLSCLLLHLVVLPDHVPSALHVRRRGPTIRYPLLHKREAWDPNDEPHEREVMAPCIGGWRTVQDFSGNKFTKSTLMSWLSKLRYSFLVTRLRPE